MTRRPLRLGTRGSRLSLRQTELVTLALRAVVPDLAVEIVVIRTAGDRAPDVPLARLEGIGIFTRDLEEALTDGRCDAAVHSAKDLPTALHPDLDLAAVLPRADPRDVLVTRDAIPLARLPEGARMATSSLRRSAQLRHIRPDFMVVPIRGNIDTRLSKLAKGDCDALCLAGAGLIRMDWDDRVTEWLEPEVMLPAPAQGALAIEARRADGYLLDVFRAIDDAPSREAVSAERAFVARLGSWCRAPAAALAVVRDGQVTLEGLLASEDGRVVLRHREAGPVGSADWLGMSVADSLLVQAGHRVADPVGRLLPVYSAVHRERT
jgi:hydroxymethylbilane synthase